MYAWRLSDVNASDSVVRVLSLARVMVWGNAAGQDRGQNREARPVWSRGWAQLMKRELLWKGKLKRDCCPWVDV